MVERKTGYLRDDPDERDYAYALRATGPLKESVNLWTPAMHIVDQGAESSCTGRALAYTLRAGYAAQGKDPGQFSAYDAYFKGRAVSGISDVDQGGQLRPLFKGVQLLGCALEKDSPSIDYAKINRAPTWKAQVSAHKYRGLRRYHALYGDLVDQAKDALSHGVPLLGGWEVRKSFSNYQSGIYRADDSQVIGGHALALLGYTDTYFICPNSWGPGYGEDGFVRLSYDFVREAIGLWAVDIQGEV